MVTSCCAFGCTYRHKKGSPIGMFRFPLKDEKRRQQWILSIKRRNWVPSEWSRICGQHFQTGRPSFDKNHPDFIPNVFSFKKKTATAVLYEKILKTIEKKDVIEMDIDDNAQTAGTAIVDVQSDATEQVLPCISYPSDSDTISLPFEQLQSDGVDEQESAAVNAEMQVDISSLYFEINALRKEKKMLQAQLLLLRPTENVLQNKANLLLYTGLSSKNIFHWLINISSPNIKCTVVSKETQLLIVLMKLKLNLLRSDIASRFSISKQSVQLICDEWIPVLAGKLRSLIHWPTKKFLKKHRPQWFEDSLYKDSVCVIDCIEVPIQKPSDQIARSQTWSTYKHGHTIKFLVAVTPSGQVCFISESWGGRASDKEVALECGFLELLCNGDVVLANRDLILAEHLLSRGAKLVVPSFTKGEKQLSKHEVDYSKNVSNLRMHVERLNHVIKKYRILQTAIPVSFLKHVDCITIICAALCNLSPSVKDKDDDLY